ncbi:MAG TPA: HDOD domain-containing protein [Terriglobales bacterium]|nr:HDOD domain-containing protein [Terriglobales bacterium]
MNAKIKADLLVQIKKLNSISTAPAILTPLVAMLRLPADEIRLEKVVELVSYDGTIAAQCLRMANSPLFGRSQIETVRGAVMALGLERVRSILLGLCVNRVIPKDKWVISSDAFWRHSLGCALVTQRMAKKIGYPEPEKAYLAGLLHDIGVLVNSVLYNQEFRECLRLANEQHLPLHVVEAQVLGFTHNDTGPMLSEQWGLPPELVEATRAHHDIALLSSAGPLACLVHLSDLLCRVSYLDYGYEESIGVDLGSDEAWRTLVRTYPELGNMDLARFTFDIEGAMDQIVGTVNSVFGGASIATSVAPSAATPAAT